MEAKPKRRFRRRGLAAAVGALAVAGVWLACPGGDGENAHEGEITGDLIIFHAGSLSVPLREVSELFQREHPGITVKAEAAGSRDCARKIRDVKRACDVLASADYRVVSNLLMGEHATYNLRFARNEMAIAYTAESRRSDRIEARNWYDILLSDGVAFGRSDPNRDPCGYRTMMVFQLAERYYKQPQLATRLAEASGRHIRAKETDLLALLEGGEIDYLFIYRSVAAQQGLKILELPAEVNLGSPAHDATYGTAGVEVTGKAPGKFITRSGEAMVYSVTVPTEAPNRKAAEAWVALLLSPRGRAIMERHGQPCITPAKADGYDNVPEALKPLVRR